MRDRVRIYVAASLIAVPCAVALVDFTEAGSTQVPAARAEGVRDVPRPAELGAAATKTTVPAAAGVPDPDGVGPCPETHSPVVRRGLDAAGRPTWWHEDGSMTLRVRQRYTAPDGSVHMLPRVVVLRPEDARPDPDR